MFKTLNSSQCSIYGLLYVCMITSRQAPLYFYLPCHTQRKKSDVEEFHIVMTLSIIIPLPAFHLALGQANFSSHETDTAENLGKISPMKPPISLSQQFGSVPTRPQKYHLPHFKPKPLLLLRMFYSTWLVFSHVFTWSNELIYFCVDNEKGTPVLYVLRWIDRVRLENVTPANFPFIAYAHE